MTTWNDFNSADDQKDFTIIPRNTLAKVRMVVRPGGYDDVHQGWTDGYATRNDMTGAVYLNAEFVVLEGPFIRRKIWSLIGLHSEKGPEWAAMGRTLIKGILNSSNGLYPNDHSTQAQQARCITGFGDLDNCVFIARIGQELDQERERRNIIKAAITADHDDYAALMGPMVSSQANHSAAPSFAPVSKVTALPVRSTKSTKRRC